MDKPLWGLKVLKFDGAIAPRVLKFDSGSAAEGCGGRLTFIEGARLYKTFTIGLSPMGKPYNRSAGVGNAFPLWCRKAPKGECHRRWLITVVLIITYNTESKSRNADFISIAP